MYRTSFANLIVAYQHVIDEMTAADSIDSYRVIILESGRVLVQHVYSAVLGEQAESIQALQ